LVLRRYAKNDFYIFVLNTLTFDLKVTSNTIHQCKVSLRHTIWTLYIVPVLS